MASRSLRRLAGGVPAHSWVGRLAGAGGAPNLRGIPAHSWVRQLAGGAPNLLRTPFISDTVPIPEGILGSIEELHLGPGDEVNEDDVIAVVETDKVSLDVKATHSGVVKAVLVEVGQTVKEEEAIYELEPR